MLPDDVKAGALDVDAAYVGGRWVSHCRLAWREGRLQGCQPRPTREPTGRVALPTFANAHVHLDLTAIRALEPSPPTFSAWIEDLIPRRRKLDPAEVADGIRRGAWTLVERGTTAVGDIDSMGLSLPLLRELPLEGVCYREVVGSPEDRFWSDLEETHAALSGATGIRLGLSPHAPYSTPAATFRRCLEWASKHAAPIASHLGETLEEEQFLQQSSGPMADLFRRMGFARPRWDASHRSSVERVLDLPEAVGQLVGIHCNYLSPRVVDALAAARARVVYCPRSHEYFGHPAPHPAAILRRQGVAVALGTDSLASNRGLDMWEEMACARRRCPDLSDEEILESATARGRDVLGLPAAALQEGDPATFQVAAARDGKSRTPEEWTAASVRAQLHTVATYLEGRAISGATLGISGFAPGRPQL